MVSFSFADIYSKAKSFLSDVYSVGKKVSSGIHDGFAWLDNAVNSLSSIPFIGTAVSEGYRKIKNSPVFGGFSLDDAQHYNDKLGEFLSSEQLTGFANAADSALTPIAAGADKILASVSAG